MAFRISFKRGSRQSLQAARYFHGVIDGLIHEIVEGMDVQDHYITTMKGPSLHLRIWSQLPLQRETLHELMDLLMTLRQQIHDLLEGPAGRQRVEKLAREWLTRHLGGVDLYVEVTIVNNDSRVDERSEFTLAMVHGRCAMMSTDQCLFTWLDRDVFGLTLAGHGSYLLEFVPEVRSDLRKAS